MNIHTVVEDERVEEQLEQTSNTDATRFVPLARQKALFEDSLLEASGGSASEERGQHCFPSFCSVCS